MRHILFLLLLFSTIQVLAQSPKSCADRLEKAEKQYRLGFFREVVELLGDCRFSDFSGTNKLGFENYRRAQKILALAFLALDNPEDAKRVIHRSVLLPLIDRSSDPLRFVEFVEKEGQRRNQRSHKKRNLLIGAGVVTSAVGGLIYYLTTREEKPEKLPDPPALP